MDKIKTNFFGTDHSRWHGCPQRQLELRHLLERHLCQEPAPEANPKMMVDYLHKNFPGAIYKAAYEAGKFGFWIQRQLASLGVECLVVNPADIPKSQKTVCKDRSPRCQEYRAPLAKRLSSRHPYPRWATRSRPRVLPPPEKNTERP